MCNNNYLFGKDRERERENVVGIEQLPTTTKLFGKEAKQKRQECNNESLSVWKEIMNE